MRGLRQGCGILCAWAALATVLAHGASAQQAPGGAATSAPAPEASSEATAEPSSEPTAEPSGEPAPEASGKPAPQAGTSAPTAPTAAELRATAAMLAAAHHLDDALALQRQALELDPTDARAWAELGTLLIAVGSHTLAIDALAQAIALDGSQPDYHASLGAAHAALGERAQARAAYRRALALSPTHADATRGLEALERATDEPAARLDTGNRATVSYRLELTLGYLAAPLVMGLAGAIAPPIAPFGLLIPPAVHWSYGEPARGILALLAWPAAMVVGALIGVAVQGDCDELLCGLKGLVIGGLVGAVAWPIVDIATAPRVLRHSGRARARVTPRLTLGLAPLRSGGAMSLSRRF